MLEFMGHWLFWSRYSLRNRWRPYCVFLLRKLCCVGIYRRISINCWARKLSHQNVKFLWIRCFSHWMRRLKSKYDIIYSNLSIVLDFLFISERKKEFEFLWVRLRLTPVLIIFFAFMKSLKRKISLSFFDLAIAQRIFVGTTPVWNGQRSLCWSGGADLSIRCLSSFRWATAAARETAGCFQGNSGYDAGINIEFFPAKSVGFQSLKCSWNWKLEFFTAFKFTRWWISVINWHFDAFFRFELNWVL